MKEAQDNRSDFFVHKFYPYTGSNFYLDKPAMVFNLYLYPDGPSVDFYKERVVEKIPDLENNYPDRVIDLFAEILSYISKMDMNLYIGKYAISQDDDEWVIALEHLDDYLAEEIVYFVSDWFFSMNEEENNFDFDSEFERLQDEFNKTIYGGPTIYSLVEGGIKRNISVHFLYEENQFQWGYGKKQRRGRSTIFHTDGIKDTEFTMYKDLVGEYLEMLGFPTPKGTNCFSENEVVENALALGWPVVVKPVSGHKGQGVTTGIESEEEVRKAYQNIVSVVGEKDPSFDGVLVQQQIYGYDHRILTVGGKFAAALKRIPAYVIGNGKGTIKELIEVENSKEIRIDNARSPLAKIILDDDMIDFLKLQNLTPDSIPAEGEEIVLRRVANISAGGVSVNVTSEIHQENIDLVETISSFYNITAMGIDVLTKDIGKSWRDGNFGIIEINAGPGVFMHLAPAEGGSVDIPGMIMEHFFNTKKGFGRIPIVAGNNISDELIGKIKGKLANKKPDVNIGSLRQDGIYLNEVFITNNKRHDRNVSIILRWPLLDFAIFNHNKDDIHDYGIWHKGMDMLILNKANYAENILKRDILKDGIIVEIIENVDEEDENVTTTELIVTKNEEELQKITVGENDNIEDLIFNAIEPHLEELLMKYE